MFSLWSSFNESFTRFGSQLVRRVVAFLSFLVSFEKSKEFRAAIKSAEKFSSRKRIRDEFAILSRSISRYSKMFTVKIQALSIGRKKKAVRSRRSTSANSKLEHRARL